MLGAREHITPSTPVADVVSHPAFRGFGRRLLPWNDGRELLECATMRDLPGMNVWHTNLDVDEEVAGLNRLIDDAASGLRVFYDIYDEVERASDPNKATTGLFFLRGEPGAPFAVILPGGGYYYVGTLHEGLPVAQEINRRGLNAFVLRYRVDTGAPTHRGFQRAAGDDLIHAVRYILDHADELQVSPDGYSLWGGSAGAHTVSDVVYGEAGFSQAERLWPAATVIAYTYFSDDIRFRASDPAAFFIVGKRDWIVPWRRVERRVRAMRSVGCTVEDHIMGNLEHGFGVGRGTVAEGWVDWAVDFWEHNR